jgi:hypothetical protein
LLAEIVADEFGAVAIDFGYELLRFFFRFADGFDAADFFFVGCVDENVEGVGAVAQEVGLAAADDDAIAARGDVVNHSVQHFNHAIGVEYPGAADSERAFVAAARVNFEEAIEERIDALVAALGVALVDIGGAGDFGGNFLVPEFPAEALGEGFGDERAAAAVFAFEGDDSYRHRWRQSETTGDLRSMQARPKKWLQGLKPLSLLGLTAGLKLRPSESPIHETPASVPPSGRRVLLSS